MANSQLALIYEALAALPITVIVDSESRVVKARYLDDLPNVVDTAHLPLRILSPFHDMKGKGVPRTIGGDKVTNTWTITDMCLWQAETQGTGMKQTAPFVISYLDTYSRVIRANLRIIDGALVEEWEFKPGVYPYPAGVEKPTFYYGILVTLTIKEIQS